MNIQWIVSGYRGWGWHFRSSPGGWKIEYYQCQNYFACQVDQSKSCQQELSRLNNFPFASFEKCSGQCPLAGYPIAKAIYFQELIQISTKFRRNYYAPNMPLFQTGHNYQTPKGQDTNRLPRTLLRHVWLIQAFIRGLPLVLPSIDNRDPVTCRYAKILPTNTGAKKRTVLSAHWILARVNVCQSSFSPLGSFVRGHVACPKSIEASVSSASFILLFFFIWIERPEHLCQLQSIGTAQEQEGHS
jgi:hypothetical protein